MPRASRLITKPMFLADARSIASNDPVWYSLAIRAASLTCDRPHEVERLVEEVAARFPSYYQSYHEALMATLSCANDKREVDDGIARIAEIAVAGNASIDGDAMYARVYWGASRLMQTFDLKHALGVDWPRMRAGVRSIIKHHPDAFNANYLARIACVAGDVELARELLPRALELPVVPAWGSEQAFEECWSRAHVTVRK